MSKKLRVFYIIISVAGLINVFFLPMFEQGGGMFPSDTEYNFARIIGDAFMKKDTLSLQVTQMTLCAFVPFVIMLASALTRMKLIYSLAGIAGLVAWFVNIIGYALKSGFASLIDVEKTDISIGSWVAVLLLLINGLVIICSKKRKISEPEEEYE